ncbi:IS66 family insertion sequence transposase domain-containing protein (plasmid) [Rhizobium sp. NXC14]|nr:IS66 family insertion sequence transposase domain-containing protein [Rhizobium sp. NXC14]
MIDFSAVPRIMVATQPVDFRKGMNGLFVLVASTLEADPYCGDIFVFRAKRGDRVRCLYWGGSGMILATKWLENGSFTFPPIKDGPMIAEVYLIEQQIRGEGAEVRYHARQSRSAAIMRSLKARLLELKADISTQSALAKAINYTLKHWTGLTAFLDDGTIEVDSNVVERSMKSVALTRKNSMFVGNARGGETFAILASLINTALCRARHKALYADRRTMPSASSGRNGKPCVPSQFGGSPLFGTRHSSHAQRVFRNSRSRSLGRNRSALARSYGFSFASADSFSSRCA